MPQPDSSQTSTRRTRLRMAVCAAGVLAAVAIFAIVARRTFLSHEFDITTLIDDSGGIGPSSPVLLNGIAIGHVVEVRLSGSPDPDKTVRVRMRFARHFLSEIPDDSTAAITSANLLGDKYINVARGSHLRHIEPGAEIPSSPTQDIGTILARGNAELTGVNRVLEHVDKILGYVDSQEGTLGKLINNPEFQKHIAGATVNQTQLTGKVNTAQGVLARDNELVDLAQRPLARLNAIDMDINQGRGSLGKFLNDPYSPTLTVETQEVTDEANRLIAEFTAGNRTSEVLNKMRQVGDRLDDTLARINAGQGTLGQFLINPQLHDSLQRIHVELARLTADFKKHPTHFVRLSFGLF